MITTILIVILANFSIFSPVLSITKETCDRGSIVDRKYLLYNINPGEGFNLRRDVYIRMACLSKHLQKLGDWILVVGPISTPHWKSNEAVEWKHFFDLNSLSKYVPVIELNDLLLSLGKSKSEMNRKSSSDEELTIDQVYLLQNFKDSWKSGKWEEKFEIAPCEEKYEKSNLRVKGRFWNLNNILVHNISCVSFQGRSKVILPLLLNDATAAPMSHHSKRSVYMIDRAEVLLHDEYGGIEYWKARRSMRFASHLYELADEAFQVLKLNPDVNILPDDWRDERKTTSSSKGGDYICGHLRRQDFLFGRSTEIPSLLSAAKQLKALAASLNTSSIFIASDGTDQEMKELRQNLKPNCKLILYRPSNDIRTRIKEGGIAIVEQIICSRAKYFIGTYESTFSFRIQEEREILNFPPETTFNRFCAKEEACEQPAKWRIIF